MSAEITIRPFAQNDAPQVRELFIVVNRLLSPPNLRGAFEAYIERALAEEIDRITAYYQEHDGGFWVAIQRDKLIGTLGLERASPDAMELRRMYVDPGARRHGIARQMLRFAEDECRRRKIFRLELSTSELQDAAIALYGSAGYRLVRQDLAQIGSNKTVGAGLRRFYFETFVTISFRSVRRFEGKMRRFAASGLQACLLMPDTGSASGELGRKKGAPAGSRKRVP